MHETVRVRPWPDPVIDTIGHDPRSLYVETFWLPTLGPTSLLLMRHLAHRFEEEAGELEVPMAATAQALGLGPRTSPSSPIVRSFSRLVEFDLAYAHRDGTVAVRRSVPPVSRRHVRRLPEHLQARHQEWLATSDGPREVAQKRALRLALVLTELGSDVDVVERTLASLRFAPALCRNAATWAQARHRALGRDVAAEPTPDDGTTEAESEAPPDGREVPDARPAA